MGLKIDTSAVFVSALLLLSSCHSPNSKSDIEIDFTQDTLHVGYVYWWDESGPFIGYCGEEYALVFTGIVRNIEKPSNEAAPLYTAQNGTIEINKVFKIKDLAKKTYGNEKFFTSDCFNGLDISTGDSVLVFCYEYEGHLSIPGKHSILKIEGPEDNLLRSTKRFIDSDQDATKIKDDISLWNKHGLGKELAQLIRCHEINE